MAVVWPGAERLEADNGSPPAMAVYKDGRVIGYVFSTLDVVRAPGFSGIPFDVIAGTDLTGHISGSKVIFQRDPHLDGDDLRESQLDIFLAKTAGLSSLNVCLVCVCLVTCVLTEAIVGVKARATCNPPPLFSNYTTRYWPAGTTVNVEIDDAWEQPDRDALANGAQKWNSVSMLDCSSVTFTNFAPRHFTDYDTDAPAGTFWFKKPTRGQSITVESFITAEAYRFT